MKDGKVEFNRADYAQRNTIVGLSSLLGHDEIKMTMVQLQLDMNPKIYKANLATSTAITGVFELAKLHWSTPSDTDIRKVCIEYIKSIAPDDVQISNNLKSFVDQKTHEMIEASRDVIRLKPITELNTNPDRERTKVSDWSQSSLGFRWRF